MKKLFVLLMVYQSLTYTANPRFSIFSSDSLDRADRAEANNLRRNAQWVRITPMENTQGLLNESIQYGKQDVVEELLTIILDQQNGTKKVKRFIDGSHALHVAALSNKPSIVTLLLQWGADPCKVNQIGQTPLQYLVASNTAVIEQNCDEPEDAKTFNVHRLSIVQQLMEHSDIYACDPISKCNLLAEAVRLNDVPVAELLLKAGADVNQGTIPFGRWYRDPIQGCSEEPLIFWAADKNNAKPDFSMLKLLLQYGVNLTVEHHGQTIRAVLEEKIKKLRMNFGLSCEAAKAIEEDILPLVDQAEEAKMREAYEKDFPVYDSTQRS